MSLHYQSGSTADNNGGSVLSHNISSDVLNDVAPNAGSNLAYTSGPKNGNDTDKAFSSGTFAKNTDSLLAMRSDASVNSVSVFRNASIYPVYVRSINYLEGRTTSLVATAIRTGKYNIYTGQFDSGFPASSSDSFGNDTAARSSFAIPGSLTFMVNSQHITTQNYPAKG
jgi:hypothetical protein